jgi:hypothetical protein
MKGSRWCQAASDAAKGIEEGGIFFRGADGDAQTIGQHTVHFTHIFN